MTPKRGMPLLIEQLKGASMRVPGTTPRSAGERLAAEVEFKPSAGGMDGRVGSPAWWRSPRQLVIVAVPTAMVLLVAVWWLAYEMGQSRASDTWARRVSDGGQGQPGTGPGVGDGDALPISDPTDPTNQAGGVGDDGGKTGGSAAKGDGSAAKKGESGGAGGPTADPALSAELVPGLNYLVVATLKRREDALEAANYLQGKGLRMAAVREREDWVVLVLQGYDRGQFGAREKEREALRQRVQAAGRTWRAENKAAPTDFAQPFWRKQPEDRRTP